ncbi:MAG TPA: DUF6600 domain-containing protein [Acetobacteraceae bacterium]|nr:DUF6600 domain-containing protein [Acetobacteraceae bacterium]
MRPPSLIVRLCAATMLSGMMLSGMLAPALLPAAQAQPAPQAAPPGQQAENPPERVGWLQRINGGVSFHTADQDQWSQAVANYPVASGDSLWTEPDASAQVAISASVIGMAGGTELDVDTLDANGLQSTLPQGEIYLDLSGLAPSEAWSVQTPRGLVTFSGPGRYDLAAGDTQDPTTVTVLAGAARVSGPGLSLQLAAGQTATITGAQTFQGSVGPAQTDAFLATWEQQPAPAPGPAAPAVVAQMPGGEDLSAYGTWTQTSDYGDVWYPQVSAGWVPYQEGYWGWVAPWGWTWIDSDPWGFAPFHYGRWVQIGGRWGWSPGVVAVAGPPVYAPALVAFFGVGAALGAGTVGWFPLAPQEPYHPWFHASDTWLRAVNRRDVRDLAAIGRPLPMNSYLNRSAVTAMPAAAMAESRPVRQAALRVDPQMLAAARPVIGTAPIRPTAATVGITPNLARTMHLPEAPRGPPAAAHVAPGPAIRRMPLVNGVAARPPLPGPSEHRPGGPPAAAARPAGLARPELRTPAAREGGPPRITPAAPGGATERHEPVPAAIARPGTVPPAAERRPAVAGPETRRTEQSGVQHPAVGPEHAAERPVAPAPGRPSVAHEAPPAAAVHRPEMRPSPPEHVTAPPEHAPAPEVRTAAPAHPPAEFHAPRPEAHAAPEFHAPPPEAHAPPRGPAPAPAHAGPPPQAHAAAAPHPAPAEHERKPDEH